MHIVCKKCLHTWDYKGNAKRISCSKCKTSITLSISKPVVEQQRQQSQFVSIKQELVIPKEFTLDLKIIMSPAWTKAIGWARSNGETHLILLPNKHGELNLKL